MKVREVMTTDVVTVTRDTPLKEVARTLSERRISGVPVVDADGTVCGVVSEADIIFKERGRAVRHGAFRWLFEQPSQSDREKLAARTAGEAMTSPAKTVPPYLAVSEAAGRMLDLAINRLPVVDRGGRLLGIVTRADLVRAFVRDDFELEREIRDEVLKRTLLLNPNQLQIAVDAGAVTVGGAVETETEAELVEAFVRRVPGVVAVDSALTWRYDEHHATHV